LSLCPVAAFAARHCSACAAAAGRRLVKRGAHTRPILPRRGRPACVAPGISPVRPAELFDEHFTDVRTWTPLLAAYFPLGCALALLRMVG
jgi:hypothetical protein